MKKLYLILLFLFSVSSAFAATVVITQNPTSDTLGNANSIGQNPKNNTVIASTPNLNFSNYGIYGAKNSTDSNLEVSGNMVQITVSGLTSLGDIYGGYSSIANSVVSNNIINIGANADNVYAYIYGGYGDSESIVVKNNKVNILAGTLLKAVYGGYGGDVADSNYIYINNATIRSSVYGGRSVKSTNNIVEIKNSVISQNASYFNLYGGSALGQDVENMESSGNTTSIEGGNTFANVFGGGSEIASGNKTIQIKNNTVNINGGIFEGIISGGEVQFNGYPGELEDMTVINNTINISGNATFTNSNLYGSNAVKVANNYINIKSGNFKNTNVYGGYSLYNPYVIMNHAASGNTVSIEGGSFEGNIYGGYSDAPDTATVEVKDNTINISGNPDLSKANLFGGVGSGEVSGNTLNLQTNIIVKSAGGFDNYNFQIDHNNIDNAVLTATESAIDMSNSVIGLYIKDTSNPLQKGDTLFLVANMGGDNLSQYSGKMRSGATIIYDWELLQENNNLYAKINEDIDPCVIGDCDGGDAGKLNPETKSLSEGYLSSLGMLIQGADLVSDGGDILESALQSYSDGMFSSVNLNSIKLNSGSYVNVQSGSLILGAGGKIDNMLYGAFLEAGGGKHNTYNEFEDSIVKGDGSNVYAGGGVLGRIASKYIYFDASIRAGYVSTDYKADYSPDAKYNIGSLYYGGHAGVGLTQNINDFSLNEYVKYLATAQQGSTVILDTQEEIKFADIMSSRAVAGVRAKYLVGYLGYAFEQELNGTANATTSSPALNTKIEAPVIKGGTSVIEAGYDQSFVQESARFIQGYSFNVGVGGKYYIGVRNGFSVNGRVGWMF